MSARLVMLIQLLKFIDSFKNRVTCVVSLTNGKPIFKHRKSKILGGQCTKVRFQRKHPVCNTEIVHGVTDLLLVKDKQFFLNDKQISDCEVTTLNKN